MAALTRSPSFSAPSGDPAVTHPPLRPRHKRTATGFGVKEIQAVQSSIASPLRDTWKKFAALEFLSKDEFEKEVVRHVETTLARSIYNCDEL